MPELRFVRPIEQPSGSFRLLDWLDENFAGGSYHTFCCLSAFVKARPFSKLHGSLRQWKAAGKRLEAIAGIDLKGTSRQALRYLLENFDAVHILHVNYATFHPKLYIFRGDSEAAAYYGSGNMTSGGLETNFEGGTLFHFHLPEEEESFSQLLACYTSLLPPEIPCTRLLTEELLEELWARRMLADEDRAPGSGTRGGASDISGGSAPLFGPFSVKPPRPIPAGLFSEASASAGRRSPTSGPSGAPSSGSGSGVPLAVTGFAIQVNPHKNGEVFLSKQALEQNGPFWSYPFSGVTAPKRSKNPSYPQRTPDPVVNIRVFDEDGELVQTVERYNLNMVYYTRNKEIRVTITPSLLSGLSFEFGSVDYPMLVMRASQTDGYDYDMDFYAKGSQAYEDYLNICNQTLPSGGKPVARKMGWF